MTPRLALRQLHHELLAFWRTPQAMFFTFLLPLLMLVVFATLNDGDTFPDGRSFAAYLVPGMLTFGVASAAYGNLAARTVYRRETGQLKRLRATPLPPQAYLAGAIGGSVLVVLAVSATLLAVAGLGYGVALPRDTILTAAWLLIGAGCFAALGLAVSTAVSNVESADPTVFATLLPIAFISGVFDQVPDGSVLGRIASVFPLQHLRLAVEDAQVGAPPDLTHLVVLLAWGIAGTILAARRFRWTPS